ncbi:MAG: universal stress protein [Myxococcota bacterium]|nr:universal stress protein [Myxococcota bacterium]
MAEIKKILVPYDFSEDSRAALELAATFAKQFDAHLTLLHCYQNAVPDAAALDLDAPDQFFHALKKAASEKLEVVREALHAEDLVVSTKVRANVPSEAIREIAEEMPADLIVMGTRGISGLKHVIVGSVAERTVRGAPCPVVTVKAD